MFLPPKRIKDGKWKPSETEDHFIKENLRRPSWEIVNPNSSYGFQTEQEQSKLNKITKNNVRTKQKPKPHNVI